jgi:hypothetical protein
LCTLANKLEVLEEDDFLGTEGWEHFFGVDEIMLERPEVFASD